MTYHFSLTESQIERLKVALQGAEEFTLARFLDLQLMEQKLATRLDAVRMELDEIDPPPRQGASAYESDKSAPGAFKSYSI